METTLAGSNTGDVLALEAVSSSPATSAIEVRVVQGVTGLLALERDWSELLASQSEINFIHSYAWQMACVRHLPGAGEAVHYFCFYIDGRPIAIFPLCRVARTVGRVPLWIWKSPSHPHIILADPLIAPTIEAAVLIGRLAEVLNQPGGLPWHVLHLPHLPEDSLLLRSLQSKAGTTTLIESAGQSMYFDCRDIDSALVNCSGAFRRNLRRQRKKLEQHGKLTLSLARHAPELDDAFVEFLRLEASGWKGDEGKASAIRLHPHLCSFYTELRDGFAWEDGCLIFLLRLDGVPIAAQFCLLAGSTLSIQKIAYDQAWHAESPGSVLMRETIDYACADPAIRQLSLVTAPEWAKGRWNPLTKEVREIHVFNGRPRALLAAALRWSKARYGEFQTALRRHRARPSAVPAIKGDQ